MRKWTKILVIAIAGALLISAVSSGMALAAEPPKNPPTSSTSPDYLTKLAARLKVSVEQLKTAMTQAHTDVLNDLVAQGRITEQQKQTMLERQKARSSAGYGLMGPGMMGRGGFGGAGSYDCWCGTNLPAPKTN